MGTLPTHIAHDQTAYTLFPTHKPEETCYAHSEVHCTVVAAKIDGNAVPKSASLALRALLAQRSEIVRRPD